MSIESDLKNHLGANSQTAHGIWTMIQDTTALRSRAKFRAYQNTQQQNLTALAWAQVVLDAESYDIGGYFNTTAYKFVVPTAGFYHFVGQVTPAAGTFSASKKFGIAIYKNGSAVAVAYQSSNNEADDFTLQISDIRRLAVGDEITLYVYSGNDNNNADLTAGATTTFFAGHILSTE